MSRYLVTCKVYGGFEKELECANENDAYLEANEMAHLYTDIEIDVEELAPEDEWP
jgi:hypothetical protein